MGKEFNCNSFGADSIAQCPAIPEKYRAIDYSYTYCSIQIDCRQTSFLGKLISDCRYRIVLPEELIAITEADQWKYQQKVSRYRYRFSLVFQGDTERVDGRGVELFQDLHTGTGFLRTLPPHS